MVYLGSVWQLKKRLGTADLIMQDVNQNPKKFNLSDKDFRALFNKKEVYAIFESMQWLVRNQLDALSRTQSANQKIIETLTAMQNEK